MSGEKPAVKNYLVVKHSVESSYSGICLCGGRLNPGIEIATILGEEFKRFFTRRNVPSCVQ